MTEVLPEVKEKADQAPKANEDLMSADRDVAEANVSLDEAKGEAGQANRVAASAREATLRATQTITALMQLKEITSGFPAQPSALGEEAATTVPVAHRREIWE